MDREEKRSELIKTHQFRYATKKFNPSKKISDTDFNTIMEIARLSPSSFGYEPWKFLVIKNEEIKKGLRPFSWGALNSLDGASHFIIALARKNVVANSPHIRYMVETVQGRDFKAVTRQQEFFKQFQENDFNLNSERELFDWASKQTYIVLGNMMSAAASLMIDSCPIEGFNRKAAEEYLVDKKLMSSDEFGISYMIGFGYSSEERPVKKRQKTSDVFEIVD